MPPPERSAPPATSAPARSPAPAAQRAALPLPPIIPLPPPRPPEIPAGAVRPRLTCPLKLIYFSLYSPPPVPLFSGPMQPYVIKLTNGETFTASASNIFTLSRELIAAGVPVSQIIPADLI